MSELTLMLERLLRGYYWYARPALVLAYAGEAGEGGGDDAGLVVVAVAGQVGDGDLGVGEGLGQAAFQFGGGHRHGRLSS